MNSLESIQAIPLGGLGEFGLNMLALRCREKIAVIDAGLMFPEDDLLGVDLVVPDITYLEDHKEEIVGYFITHGHEDHIGALPYVLPSCPAPVYATRFTLSLIQSRLKEHRLFDKTVLNEVLPRQVVEADPFTVEFLAVTHSIPDSACLAIRTPAGVVVCTGDFKFDHTPVDGQKTDYARLAAYGEEGVLALFSDSTNSERHGYTPPETSIHNTVERIFREARGVVYFCCFASNTYRMQLAIDCAHRFGRRLAVLGRSMCSNLAVADRLGLLRIPPDVLINEESCRLYSPDKLAILVTGSQGEPRAVLPRIALGEFKNLQIQPGDTVILSARNIPGNEKLIGSMVNHLAWHGARVYTDAEPNIHVSGHGSEEDLKLMINLTRPRFMAPIHGEISQLRRLAELAEEVGIPGSHVFLLQSGDVLELREDGASLSEPVQVGRRYIDEDYYGEVDRAVVRERRHLSEDGFVLAVVAIGKTSRCLEGAPEVVARGYLLDEHFELVREELVQIIIDELEQAPEEELMDLAILKDKIRKCLKRFLFKKHQKKPMIVPVVVEI